MDGSGASVVHAFRVARHLLTPPAVVCQNPARRAASWWPQAPEVRTLADAEWDRVKAVFQQALDQPPDASAAWVDAACEPEQRLRDEVRALLTAYEQTPAFMETPAIWSDAALSAVAEVAEASVWVGRRIGAYRMVRELGRGGMGRVFLAERADAQFDRRVAVKIVRQTADVELLLDRFTHERRILAAFDHANIARLLDAGATDEGIPYVVMEYVDGLPIDDYCSRRSSRQTSGSSCFVRCAWRSTTRISIPSFIAI